MCFGMGVACTPESGYNYPSIIELHTHDTAHNCQQVQKMQEMTEEEYFARVEKNLQEVKKKVTSLISSLENICEDTQPLEDSATEKY